MRGPREINLAETLKMYEVYAAGATMEAVGDQFRRTKGTIQKAFARWNLPVRGRGSPRREIIDVPPRQPKSIAVLPRFQPPRSWCDQCERRVSVAEAGQCGSKFCAVKHLANQSLGLAIAGHEMDKAARHAR